jgi:diguanylate cyclase (GGDEF)-like protein
MKSAQTLADVAAAYLLNARARAGLQHTLEEARQSALHDPLTGLANRTLFVELLESALLRNRRSEKLTGVLFCDLDRFKEVNDSHGHRVGDELLVLVADRLKGVLRPGDTLARLAGDEFVILCEGLEGRQEGGMIANRVIAALGEPFPLSVGAVGLSASIGVAFAGRSGIAPDELLHQADIAMYGAKHAGGSRYQMAELPAAMESST